MAAYFETKNTHEARNEAVDNGNSYFANLIWAAWAVCDRLDPMWECDTEDFATIIEAVREAGEGQMADELAAEAARAYGDIAETVQQDMDVYAF